MIDEPYDPTSDRTVRISLASGLALRGKPLETANRMKIAGTELMRIIDPSSHLEASQPEPRTEDGNTATMADLEVDQLLKEVEEGSLGVHDDSSDEGDNDKVADADNVTPLDTAMKEEGAPMVANVGCLSWTDLLRL